MGLYSHKFPLLSEVDDPRQIRDMSPDQLQTLADELRGFLIEVTSQTGGHLAPGLGEQQILRIELAEDVEEHLR